jgi:hypothetical protein
MVEAIKSFVKSGKNSPNFFSDSRIPFPETSTSFLIIFKSDLGAICLVIK